MKWEVFHCDCNVLSDTFSYKTYLLFYPSFAMILTIFFSHSQKFAHELQDLIGTVENAQAERQRQYDLENKVAFLREKLAVLERALTLHKKRLNVIFPELQESHAKVMSSRQRSIELNNLCIAIGREVQGSGYR